MSFHDQDIVTAEFAEAPAPQAQLSEPPKSRSCFFPCLIVFGIFVLLMIGAGFAIYKALSPSDIIVQTPEQVESAFEKRNESIRDALSNSYQPADQGEYASIKRFVGRVAEVADNTVNPDIHALINFDRYAKEMRRHPELGSLAYLGNSFAAVAIQERVIGPVPFSTFQVFDIEEVSEKDRKVLLHTSGAYDDSAPFLFWITKAGKGRWKLYDWEMLDYGIRETREAAILIGDHDVNRALDYERYVDAIENLDDDVEFGSKESGHEFFEVCQSLEFNELLEDSTFLSIALNLSHYSLNDEAMQFLDRISDEEKTPGSFRLRAEIHSENGKHEEAIANLQKYIEQIGPSSSIVESLANIYSKLGDRERELETRRMSLSFDQGPYSSNVSSILLMEDPDKVSDILERVNLMEMSEQVYDDVLSQLSENPFVLKHLEAIATHLESVGADQQMIDLAKGEVEYLKTNYKEAFELFSSDAMRADEDKQYDFWSRVINLGKTKEIFATADDKLAAFETISYIFEEYEHDFSPEDFLALTKEVIKLEPEEPRFHHLAGSALYDMDQFEEAVGYFETARKQYGGDDAEDYESSYNDSLLAQCYYEVDRNDDMLSLVDERSQTTVLHYIKEDKRLHEFTSLVNQCEPETRRYYQALTLLERGDHSKAKDRLLRLLKEAEPNEYGEIDNLHRIIASLIESCGDDRSAAIQAFNSTFKTSVFTQLSARMTLDGDWESANQLLTAGQLAMRSGAWSASDSEYQQPEQVLRDLRNKVLWHKGHYGELAGQFKSLTPMELSEDLEAYRPMDFEYEYRAALRTNDKIFADTIAEHVEKQSMSDRVVLELAAAHAGDFEKLKEIRDQKTYGYDDLLNDPDAPEISRGAWRKVTGDKARRLNLNPYYSEEEIIALVEEPIVFKKEDASTFAKALLSEPVKIVSVESTDGGNHQSWIIRGKRAIISIRVGGRFDTVATEVPEDLKTAFEKHKASIVIGFDTSEWNSDEPRELSLKAVDSFDFKSPVAIAWNDYWMTWESGQENLNAVKGGKLWPSQYESLASMIYLYPETDEGDDDESSNWYMENNQFMKTLATAYQDYRLSDSVNKRLIVFTKIHMGSSVEVLQISVDSIVAAPWNQNTLTGQLINDCTIDPTYFKGDKVECSASNIYKWQLTIDGKETSNEE